MQIRSKVDPDTYYIITCHHIRICREGDKMTMAYGSVPEQAKRFKTEIREELMALYTERHPLIECAYCGNSFNAAKGKKYCSPECSHAAAKEKAKARVGQMPQICVWCGEPFKGYNGTLYCGSECKKEVRRSKVKEDTRPTWEGKLQEKLQLAESKGTTYAEMQKQETLKMVGKVVI